MNLEAFGAHGGPKNLGQRVFARVQIISVALLCFALTACSPEPSSSAGLATAEDIDLGSYAHVSADLDFEAGAVTLPLEAITIASPEVDELRMLAGRAYINECLAEKGLPAYIWPDRSPEMDDRLYGLWSVPLAARFGYGLPGGEDQEPPRVSAEQEGCFSAARIEMEDKLKAIDAVNFDDDVRRAAYVATLASAEGKAALDLAQDCMRDAGLSLDSESGFPRLESAADYDSEAGIRTAVIQATCNVETGAIQTLYDLTARYQAALIDQNETAVVALADQKAELVDYFARIIDENS